MKTALMVLVGLVIAGPVFGEEKKEIQMVTSGTITHQFLSYADTIPFDSKQIANIIISCGKGSIEISLLSGEATFKDCNPSEASKALWLGLKPYFEAWKKEICQGKKP